MAGTLKAAAEDDRTRMNEDGTSGVARSSIVVNSLNFSKPNKQQDIRKLAVSRYFRSSHTHGE